MPNQRSDGRSSPPIGPDDWQRVKAIFADALECDASERELLVAVRCGEDVALRREVLRLLAAHGRAQPGFLEQPTGGPLGSRLLKRQEETGELEVTQVGEPGARSEQAEPTLGSPDAAEAIWKLGSYRVVRRIGEGGMGEVHEAIQEEPVRRRVALKLIKPGMTNPEMLTRFEAERQALALMDHSSIARVYDAGQSEDGRLFFAMEFVQGVPITDYCDRQRLATEDRLELFIRVCDAVQHAHQKGIIHRDLKPSNVLVAVEDERPVPKIIDFGVAKATTQSLTEQPLHTVMGQVIGTPEYMSPEQADPMGLDIDTRSDVYALGMLLYKLLTGFLPFDWKQLRESGFDAIRRSIKETEAPLPSARFAASGPDSEAAAEQRGTRPADLLQELRGDLDWIVMRTLEKDRTRRYQTARELALDLRRHLNHEPVTACPPSPLYRARKFVRRHRLGVAAAGAVLATLILAVVGTATGLVRARRAEAVAREAEGRATREAEAAKQVSVFLQDLFEVSDPGEARGSSITARELLDRGAERILTDLEGQPATQAQLQATMGSVYFKLGLYGDARDLLEKSLEVRRRLLGEDHLDVAQILWDLGHVEQASGNLARAEHLFQETLRIRTSELGELHADTGSALAGLAGIYWTRGQFGKATEVAERVVRIHESNLGPEHPTLARSLHNLALCLREAGRSEEALSALERARRIHEAALGTDHPHLATILNSLAIVHRDLGRERQAEQLYREALSISERVLGDRHPAVARQLNNLAILYMELGRYDDAEPLFERCLAVRQGVLGPDHHEVAITVNDLGVLYSLQGRYEEAEPLLERALRIQERARGADHPFVADALRDLGNLYRLTGASEAAEPPLRRAMAIWEQNPDHPELVDVPNQLAAVLRELGRVGEAEVIAARAVSE